ncbi:ATP-binding protein [Jidongwangia harbinensis]|uniref:ATP-binding protein n=1 Tax=Jidongwangia harbinensis TaxID=2878561 RepID=UPI001CD9F580|nr:XRE family transcriptional regulator [Jidongwangia harbinensis]MCA2213975.1 tetratricopeptide repeat protein [Jidongwangia harbinensis]
MFSELLRSHRRRSGLTQEELAHRSAVSVRNIRDLETGRIQRPRPATVRRLADALGLDGPDRARFVDGSGPATPVAPLAARPRPAQLPADTTVFVGRDTELGRLGAGGPAASGAATVWTVTGPPGVGKTCLAVHWAHRSAARFPDGQLYLNMRGYGPDAPVAPQEAVRGFLDALGLPPDAVPGDSDAQFSLYRSVLAGKRVLVLLDNVRDAAQVRPLLPAASGCVVLVTSRNPLRGLVVTDGAHPVDLDLFTPEEATQLLSLRVGAARLAGHPAAVRAIVDKCQRLPLALAVVAGRLVCEPRLAVPSVAGELAATPMAAFASDDEHTDLRSVFSWSYRILSSAAARLFRLLGLHAGPDVTAEAAAALFGVPVDDLLAELTRTQLLAERSTGRYAMHDLLRAYAADLVARTDPPEERRAARQRLLDLHLNQAATAAYVLEPRREPLDGKPPDVPDGLDEAAAIAWFDAERTTLLALIRMAAAEGFEDRAWRLAWSMTTPLQRRGHWFDLHGAHQTALTAATRSGDVAGQMHAHRGLARAFFRLRRIDEGRAHVRIALEQAVALGDVVGRARAHLGLGYAAQQQGRQDEAIAELRRAVDLFEEADQLDGAAESLNSIAWCHTLTGDTGAARDQATRAIELFRRVGSRHGEATALDTLGRAYGGMGDHRRALECHLQAREVFRVLGDRYSEAETLRHLAEMHDAAGDPGAAADARTQADLVLAPTDQPNLGGHLVSRQPRRD